MTMYIQGLYQEALGATIDFLPNLMSGLCTLALVTMVYMCVGVIFNQMLKTHDRSKYNVLSFLKKFCRSAIAIIGAITVLGTFGIDVSALVAGLGLTGFALGFALKDGLSNILAGTMILIYRPFGIDDNIDACGVVGRIIDIDMRYTTLESSTGKHLIPNSKLLCEKVTVLKNSEAISAPEVIFKKR